MNIMFPHAGACGAHNLATVHVEQKSGACNGNGGARDDHTAACEPRDAPHTTILGPRLGSLRRSSSMPTLAEIPGGCLRCDATCVMENFGAGAYPVYDLSGVVSEMPARSIPHLKVVRGGQIFAPGTVFLGFGLPNVFLAEVHDNTDILKVDAKSFRRGPTTLVHTHRVQSGFFVVPTDLPDEAVAELREAAQELQGSYHTTCAHANSRILAQAHFTIAGDSIVTLMPHDLLRRILLYGMEYQGKAVDLKYFRTTPLPLARFYDKLCRAELDSGIRHGQRACDTEKARAVRVGKAAAIEEAAAIARASSIARSSSLPDDAPAFQLSTSQASSIAVWARAVWGPHTIFRIDISSAGVDPNTYLPNSLTAFPDNHPSMLTLFKRDVLFSRPILKAFHANLAPRFRAVGSFNEDDLVRMLPTHTPENEAVFNLVVTSTHLMLMRNHVCWSFVDWVLSKHVLISNYSHDVRFAGELFKTADGRVNFNSNSGTFKPDREELEGMTKLARVMFPNLHLVPGGKAEVKAPAPKNSMRKRLRRGMPKGSRCLNSASKRCGNSRVLD